MAVSCPGRSRTLVRPRTVGPFLGRQTCATVGAARAALSGRIEAQVGSALPLAGKRSATMPDLTATRQVAHAILTINGRELEPRHAPREGKEGCAPCG